MKLLAIIAVVGAGYYYALTGMANMALVQIDNLSQQYQAAADYADEAMLASTRQ